MSNAATDVTPPIPESVLVGGVGLGAVPKQQRGIEVRDRLYEAAIREIDSKGIEESRVENIVAEAGTSWGTFFRYFPRKEDIFLHESARNFREHLRPAFDEAVSDDSASIRDSARTVILLIMEPRISPRFHAEMLAEVLRHPARFAAILGEGELPLAVLMAGLLVEGQKRGEVKAGAPIPVCAAVLLAGVMFSASTVLEAVAEGTRPGSDIAEVANQAFDLAWSGVGT
ncbi:MAG: TetR/AcrR family transcriptional regulator [Solirubrobacterales bacterium]|nr:TetR/AcrR family transcriptional regulator [Solirubrobacterales bacterium]MCB8915870.1 TetR/AcrR family transcriptional regulator [Thermoleophilales bacterium]